MDFTGVPVLNYHAIDDTMTETLPQQNVSVSLQSFKKQMAWLHEQGYQSITEKDLHDLVLRNKKIPGKHVLITFDDGYHSLYKHALEIMSGYHFTGTLFLSTSYIGKYYELNDFHFVGDDRQLTWDEIKALSSNGWSIQSHGHNHFRMNKLDKEAVIKEVIVSKQIIEGNLGKAVDAFAFPYGLYNKMVIDQMVAAGYKMSYSIHSGKLTSASNRFRLPRIEINSADTMVSFKTKVLTGYISPKNAMRSKLRDMVYANASVKDFLEKITPMLGFGNTQ